MVKKVIRRSKKRTKIHKKTIGFFPISIFSAVVIIFTVAVLFLGKTMPETPENEMATMPPDVQRLIDRAEDANDKHKVLGVFGMRLPILMYHYVEYVEDKGDKIRQILNIEPWLFEDQIKTLKEDGYTFLTMQDVMNMFSGKEQIPEKPIVLTFDDGYRDFYTDVFPILKKYNAKAVAYVVPNFINNRNNMTTAQLEEVAKSSLVEIGAHTMNHVWLRGIKKETAENEIAESRKTLEKELGIPITAFAYPYGAFDEQAVKLVKEAGYANAVSTLSGIDAKRENLFFTFRLRPGVRSGKVLLDFLRQDSFKAF